ncbi:hypothetical protein Pan14r_40480 [Crateriforma conspicua]|uniref:Uncharacterized protein n=1 Tax=Crateriforma conspicua TaxID=2527996 RepID=A0A5C5YER6_9PLAN|nr:hypothetical protein Mal65_12270 [Crateriforma conspicua]TWT71732.1 hypothetical protein Pan14r_40480 [Crateriforma conspicua]
MQAPRPAPTSDACDKTPSGLETTIRGPNQRIGSIATVRWINRPASRDLGLTHFVAMRESAVNNTCQKHQQSWKQDIVRRYLAFFAEAFAPKTADNFVRF